MTKRISSKFKLWANNHIINLAILLLFIMLMQLLRSAGYFHPYYLISVDFIVTISTIAAILILGIGREVIVGMLIMTWISISSMYLLGMKVWADTTTIYVYELLLIDIVLQICKTIKSRKSD